jgi:hypothetical protein
MWLNAPWGTGKWWKYEKRQSKADVIAWKCELSSQRTCVRNRKGLSVVHVVAATAVHLAACLFAESLKAGFSFMLHLF